MDIPMSGTRLTDWNVFGDWIWASLQALAVVVVAYMTYRQRSYTDLRARTQWAIEASPSTKPMRSMMGTAALKELQKSELATDADQRLLKSIADSRQFETMLGAQLTGREPKQACTDLDRDSKAGENERNEGGPGTDGKHHK